MRVIGFTILAALLAVPVPTVVSASDSWWTVQTTGLDSNLRGISVIRANDSRYIVWASGSNGAILRAIDGGKTWKQLTVTGGSDLDFRDIEAFDEHTAYVMSSGDGNKSRIYKTQDGGTTWKLQYSDVRPGFFLDSLACDSKTHCFALSDPVDGRFLILSTKDGQHWKETPRDKMPVALSKEGAFAASGTSIAVCGKGHVFFGTGGSGAARIFHSADLGQSWAVAETPIASSNSTSGVFSVACRGSSVVAIGGDYKSPSDANRVAANSNDNGKTWRLAVQQPGGFRSAVSVLPDGSLVSVGTNGTDIAHAPVGEEMHWQHTDNLNLNAVSFAGTEGWAAGPKGTIARFNDHAANRTRKTNSASSFEPR